MKNKLILFEKFAEKYTGGDGEIGLIFHFNKMSDNTEKMKYRNTLREINVLMNKLVNIRYALNIEINKHIVANTGKGK